MTLVEVCIGLAVLGTVLLAAGAAFSSSIVETGRARRLAEATLFLEGTLENVSEQSYANLLALHGTQVFDGPTLARSSYTVDLAVFRAAVDLVQVRAVLTDIDRNRELGRVTLQRSRR